MGKQKKEKYHIEGYLEDVNHNVIKRNLVGETYAVSWEEAENNVAFNCKVNELKLTKDAKVYFKQTEEQKERSWKLIKHHGSV